MPFIITFTNYNPAKTFEPIHENLMRTYSEDEVERNKKLEEDEWELSLEPEGDGKDYFDIPDNEKLFKNWGLEEQDEFKKPRDDKMKKEDIEFAKTMTGEVSFEEFKSFEGSMAEVNPIEVDMSKDKLEFMERRKIEKTA